MSFFIPKKKKKQFKKKNTYKFFSPPSFFHQLITQTSLRVLPHERDIPKESLHTHAPGQSLAEDSKTKHPMEIIMKNLPRTEFQTKVRNRAMLYGPASAIHLQMDRAILSTVQRLPMLPSDRVGLECVMGQDQTMGYSDFLGDPDLDLATTAVKMSVTDIVEAGLGY